VTELEPYLNGAARDWHAPSTLGSTLAFHRSIPGYAPTPLLQVEELAVDLGVGRLLVKVEADRFGLPAFKVLGASWAVARALTTRFTPGRQVPPLPELVDQLAGTPAVTLSTATDGNHGRALARVGRWLGLPTRVYLPDGVSTTAAGAIAAEGAEVIVVAGSYDHAVAVAAAAAAEPDQLLVQDTAWPGYQDVPAWIVAGYGTLFAELDAQLADLGVAPDLVVVPVGVGSLAQAAATHYRAGSSHRPSLLAVEPDTAAGLLASLHAGHLVTVPTGTTVMTGLNCGTPSELAWPVLQGGLDAAAAVSDEQCRQAVEALAGRGLDVGPCGAATLAGLRPVLHEARCREALRLTDRSTVVLVSTEGAAANPLPT
jgi:diaminopropionate ammonia-lyase